jgi:hypothetical protein
MLEPHQVSSGSIDRNTPETGSSKLLVLFEEHIDNFSTCLPKPDEKYPHGVKTPTVCVPL